jgi:hypothetical protein
MKIPLKLITSIGTSILFFISSSTKVQAERKVSSELLQIVKLSEERSECIADANKRDKMVSIPTSNGHSRPGCILFEALVDIDSNSSLKTWNWHEGIDAKKYVSGRLKKNQKVYVIESNNKIGNQPAVLVGIPEAGGTEAKRFATVELRYLRYLK